MRRKTINEIRTLHVAAAYVRAFGAGSLTVRDVLAFWRGCAVQLGIHGRPGRR